MKLQTLVEVVRPGLGHGSPAKVVIEFKSDFDRQMALIEAVGDAFRGVEYKAHNRMYTFSVCSVPVEFTVAKCQTCGHQP